MIAPNIYHRELVRFLQSKGVLVSEEHQFGPYSVDIYLPEFGLALEVDGPTHSLSRKKDALRDAYLKRQYGLNVLRVKEGTPKAAAWEEILRWASER